MEIDQLTFVELHLDGTASEDETTAQIDGPAFSSRSPESTDEETNSDGRRWVLPLMVIGSVAISIAVTALARSFAGRSGDDARSE